eukprot:TRINITY_DN1146_c0_g1_i3.p1 TRINITY_DN1146_c0_g1~~TRINITY_DN1146_c0_g1_i3.p1  ORF type:complete len:390 (+),score=89.76 TRINITY_DN1146_c0_g1_i3:432-1601(+)
MSMSRSVNSSATVAQPNRSASYIKYWTTEEDKALVDAVTKHGCNWSIVEDEMRPWGRSKQQCCLRWSYNLDPQINRGPFTVDEDKKLLDAQASMGNKWKQIAESLGTKRHPIALRHRWVYLINGGGPDAQQPEDGGAHHQQPSSPHPSDFDMRGGRGVGLHGTKPSGASGAAARKRKRNSRYDDMDMSSSPQSDPMMPDDMSVSSGSPLLTSQRQQFAGEDDENFEFNAAELLQALGSGAVASPPSNKRAKLYDEPRTPPGLDNSYSGQQSQQQQRTLSALIKNCTELQRDLTHKISAYEQSRSEMQHRIADLERTVKEKNRLLESTTRDFEMRIGSLQAHMKALLDERMAYAAAAAAAARAHQQQASTVIYQQYQQQQQQQNASVAAR